MKYLITLLLLGTVPLLAQDISVTGTVTDDADGQPLIGVNILVEGTATGTITDLDGNYRLSVPADATLVFSYTGFTPETVAVNGRNLIDLSMTAGTRLDEVVVTALGISREKKALGYAVQELNGDELTATQESNLVNSLQGKVAGVLINSSSGAPGAGSNIVIRGITSFGDNNQPLFVVDGVPIDNSTIAGNNLPSAGSNSPGSSEQSSFTNRAADINPADIASVSVLKGPAATALYGLRAANGVILITTKTGTAGKAQVSLNSSYGISEIAKRPEYQTDYREGRFGRLRFRGDGSPLRFQQFGPKVYSGLTPQFDPIDDFFQSGYSQDHSLSISGGTDKATFATSFSYLDQEGIIPNSTWSRLTGRLSGTVKASDKLKFTGSVNYTNSGGNKPHSGDKSILSSLSYHVTSFDVNDYINADGSQRDYSGGIIDSPRYLAEFSTLNDDVDRFLGNMGFTYEPTDWFTLSYRAGLDFYNDSRVRVVPAGLDVSSQVGGFIIETDIDQRQFNGTLTLNFKKQLTDRIGANLLLGHEMNERRSESTNVRGERFTEPDFFHLSNTEVSFIDNSKSLRRIVSGFGLLSLDFDNAIYLDITGRNDWSSTLPIENRSFFYPSASLSLVLSELMGLPSFVTFAKIRGSVAQVAKDTNPYLIGTLYGQDPAFPQFGTNGFRLNSVFGDLNLKPETTTSSEVGLDLRFFNNRLGLDITYYQQNSKDQILQVPVSNTTGFSRFLTNAGEIENKGIEVLLNATPVERGDFTWDASLNYTRNRGEVISIRDGIEEIVRFEGTGGITYKLVPGGQVGDLYGYAFNRDDADNLIIGSDGFPSLNLDTLVKVGNALPNFTAGLTNTFRYKGVGLSVLLEWRDGGDMVDMGIRNSIRNGLLEQTARRYEEVIFNGVTETGETNTQPVEITGETLYRSFARYNGAAEVILEDASWFRIRRVSVFYDLPKALLGGGKFISTARVTLTGNNLFINTPFRGFDPETNYLGSGSSIYGFTGLQTPGVRTYTASLNLTF
ncbi:SusC/RagA family TonB-linked outer membrane protein [Lewinella cohaerens]|uniref:SusC/RagA family TonB-linked outer membrane protein n=1 Tax=Lewinella cohaerens TaxID=70995 RepID=UPI00036658C6|nr:SusC/RagA family TonB-linked outer membrane protein [Lewinella cohaerens]